MKVEVRYYTQTGNTKKLADVIAKELGVEAHSIDHPLQDKTDILVLCNSVYWAGVDGHVKSFLKENKSKIGYIVNVSTAALMESSLRQMQKIAFDTGIKISDLEFHCKGQFKALHKGHPNEDDLRNAKQFAKRLKEKLHE